MSGEVTFSRHWRGGRKVCARVCVCVNVSVLGAVLLMLEELQSSLLCWRARRPVGL